MLPPSNSPARSSPHLKKRRVEGPQDWNKILDELSVNNLATVTMQDQRGIQRPVLINTTTGTFQYCYNDKWRNAGTGTGKVISTTYTRRSSLRGGGGGGVATETGETHDRGHSLVSVEDHLDVQDWLNQPLLTTSPVTFQRATLTTKATTPLIDSVGNLRIEAASGSALLLGPSSGSYRPLRWGDDAAAATADTGASFVATLGTPSSVFFTGFGASFTFDCDNAAKVGRAIAGRMTCEGTNAPLGVEGFGGYAYVDDTAAPTWIYGAHGAGHALSGYSGTLAKAYGVAGEIINEGSGTITEAIGFGMLPIWSAGTLTTLIGLDIPTLTAGGTNYLARFGAGTIALNGAVSLSGIASGDITIAPASGSALLVGEAGGSYRKIAFGPDPALDAFQDNILYGYVPRSDAPSVTYQELARFVLLPSWSNAAKKARGVTGAVRMTGTGLAGEAIGIAAGALNDGSATAPLLIGTQGQAGTLETEATGDVTEARGGHFMVAHYGSGTLATGIGAKIGNAIGAGSITTQIGIDFDDLTRGVTNYLMRFGAAGELLCVGTPTFKANAAGITPLAIRLASSQSVDAFKIMHSDGATVLARHNKDGWYGVNIEPAHIIDVARETAACNIRVTRYGDAYSGQLSLRQARGTIAAPSATQSGDNIATHYAQGYGATAFKVGARINFHASENWTDAAVGTSIEFRRGITGTATTPVALKLYAAGYAMFPTYLMVGTDAAPATVLELAEILGTNTVADGYAGALTLGPGYTHPSGPPAVVSRHNYIDVQNPSTSIVTITDACVFRFNAAAGTHAAVDAGTTKSSPGTVNAWVKININGTLYYIPTYTSKTS